jgi:hypothetical protein
VKLSSRTLVAKLLPNAPVVSIVDQFTATHYVIVLDSRSASPPHIPLSFMHSFSQASHLPAFSVYGAHVFA